MKAFKLVLCVLVLVFFMGCSDSFIQSAPVEEPSIEISADSIKGYIQLDSLYGTTEDFGTNYVLQANDSHFVRNPAFRWPDGCSSVDSIFYTQYGYVTNTSVTTLITPYATLPLNWTYYYCYMGGCPQMGELPLKGGLGYEGYCFYLQKVGYPLYMYNNQQVTTKNYPYLVNGENFFGVVLGVRQLPSGFIVKLASVGGHGFSSVIGYAYIPKNGNSIGFYQHKLYMQSDAYGRLHN